MKSEIKSHGGVPTLFVNDRPVAGMAYITYITENTSECFKIMKNNADFYRSAIENNCLSPDDIDEIIELTDSLECRVMLLEYRRSFLEKRGNE